MDGWFLTLENWNSSRQLGRDKLNKRRTCEESEDVREIRKGYDAAGLDELSDDERRRPPVQSSTHAKYIAPELGREGFGEICAYMCGTDRSPSRRNTSKSPIPERLISILCGLRIFKVRVTVKVKTKTSKSACASHAKVRSVCTRFSLMFGPPRKREDLRMPLLLKNV